MNEIKITKTRSIFFSVIGPNKYLVELHDFEELTMFTGIVNEKEFKELIEQKWEPSGF